MQVRANRFIVVAVGESGPGILKSKVMIKRIKARSDTFLQSINNIFVSVNFCRVLEAQSELREQKESPVHRFPFYNFSSRIIAFFSQFHQAITTFRY